MPHHDLALTHFAAHGTPPFPPTFHPRTLHHNNATLHYSHPNTPLTYPVLLLHGGLGHSGNFSHQLPALLSAGYHPILFDTRGHGSSSRDTQPFSYNLLAADVLALLDHLQIPRLPLIGWSDGACTALVLAKHHPSRVSKIFFFACNTDPTGTKPFTMTETIANCLHRHKLDFAALSPESQTPGAFDRLMSDLGPMQSSQPNYTATDLQTITTPITIAQAEHDEFIHPDHPTYLSHALPNATLIHLPAVSHFAPLQHPDTFNAALLSFLRQ